MVGTRAAIRAGFAFVLLACLALGAALPAGAAEELPDRIAAYLDHGLLDRLRELYGLKDGRGIDFDDTAKVGEAHRVWHFTNDFLSGQAARAADGPEDAVQLENLWAAPVSVGGTTVGLAIVWVNPHHDTVELAEFFDAEIADALANLPAGARLVHDPARGAWLALVDRQLSPLVPGTSGLGSEAPVIDYPVTTTGPSPVQPENDTSPAITIVLAGALILAILVLVAWPARRRSAADDN